MAIAVVGGIKADGGYDPERSTFYDEMILKIAISAANSGTQRVFMQMFSPAMAARFFILIREIDSYASDKTGIPTHDNFKDSMEVSASVLESIEKELELEKEPRIKEQTKKLVSEYLVSEKPDGRTREEMC